MQVTSHSSDRNAAAERTEHRTSAKRGSADAFSEIPGELLSRILFNLSAADLTASAAPVCRSFKAAASDALLWKNIYFLRWGDEAQLDDKAPSWKVPSYFIALGCYGMFCSCGACICAFM